MELPVQVAPLAQAHVGQEAVAAELSELAIGLLVLERIVEEAPQLDQPEELGALVGERGVRAVRRLGLLHRPLARIPDREPGGDDQHLGETALVPSRNDHARQAGVDRQLGEAHADRREPPLAVHRTQFGEQAVAVGDRARRRGFDEREILHLAQLERLHAQNHARQRRAQDLRVGEGGPRLVIILAVEADAHSAHHPATTTGALVGRGARDLFHLQHLDLVAVAVAVHPRQPRVDHVLDAGHGERGFGDVGREHDPAHAGRLEHPLLLLGRQPGEQRQDLAVLRVVLAQRLGSLPDLALSGQEHEDVAAGGQPRRLVHGLRDRIGQVDLLLVFVLRLDRPVAHLHGIQASRHFDHRRAVEVRGETLRVDGRGGDDELELRPARQQALDVAQEKIDVEAAFMRLVDDDRVVGVEEPIGLRLGQQNAVGHDPQKVVFAHPVAEANAVADLLPERRTELLRDARCDGARGDAARLRVGNHAGYAAFQLQADLWQLRGLPRAGLPGHDHDLMLRNRRRDLVPLLADRQLLRVSDARQAR